MLDLSVLITIVPPIVTALFAYLIARKRNILTERINRAKLDADVQSQALAIVQGAMDNMRADLHKEIAFLKEENVNLRKEVEENKSRLETLQEQLVASDELVETLRSEISTLKKTVSLYEEEIERLRNNSSGR